MLRERWVEVDNIRVVTHEPEHPDESSDDDPVEDDELPRRGQQHPGRQPDLTVRRQSPAAKNLRFSRGTTAAFFMSGVSRRFATNNRGRQETPDWLPPAALWQRCDPPKSRRRVAA